MARDGSNRTWPSLLAVASVAIAACVRVEPLGTKAHADGSAPVRDAVTARGAENDSAMPVLACDGATTFSTGGGAGPVFADAGTPPPDCIAPCIWELLKDCLPAGSCINQSTRRPPNSNAETEIVDCAPALDWWQVGYTAPHNGNSRVYEAGRLCFAFDTGFVPNVSSSGCSTWNDGQGATRARIMWGDGYGPVLCGVPDALDALQGCGNPKVPGADITKYDVDPSQPHCAPWRAAAAVAYGGANCPPGCCAGAPPAGPSPF